MSPHSRSRRRCFGSHTRTARTLPICAATTTIYHTTSRSSRPMRLPERPTELRQLDLMVRLKSYSEGTATWLPDAQRLGQHERKACEELYVNLTSLIEKCLHPLMNRVTSREMQTFTMHDHAHGLKVSHLMWHILQPSRRELLVPGEIALLLLAAHLHDLGMGLSPQERKARLSPTSDLWDRLDADSSYFQVLENLSALSVTQNSGCRTRRYSCSTIPQRG